MSRDQNAGQSYRLEIDTNFFENVENPDNWEQY
jgi:hypothetical protein